MDLISALPEEVFNVIATYLNSKDVLESSLVCKHWYQIFGQSYECMKKVTAKYTNYNYQKVLDTFLKSDRNYQNIKIGFKLNQYMGFELEQNIKAILEKFSSTIVTLETTHDIENVSDLPKLKELYMENTYSRFYRYNSNYLYSKGLMENGTNIKKLTILSPGSLDDESLAVVQKSLMSMDSLKSLTINDDEILQITEYSFRLEEIDLITYQTAACINFLKAHRSSLNIIRLSNASSENIALFLSEFPKLHTLHIKGTDYKGTINVEFPRNSTIKTLIISCYVSSSDLKLDKILTELKTLEHLKLYNLTWEAICVSSNCSTIKTVEFQTLDRISTEQKKRMKNGSKIRFIKRRVTYVYS